MYLLIYLIFFLFLLALVYLGTSPSSRLTRHVQERTQGVPKPNVKRELPAPMKIRKKIKSIVKHQKLVQIICIKE